MSLAMTFSTALSSAEVISSHSDSVVSLSINVPPAFAIYNGNHTTLHTPARMRAVAFLT
jgi:hypothetical protein